MKKGSYKIFVGNYDWGAAVDRTLITFEDSLETIDLSKLHVTERKMAGDEAKPMHDLYEKISERQVVDAYLCDEEGRKVDSPSRYLMVELAVDPVTGSPFACTYRTQIFIWSDPYELRFDYAGEWDIDPVSTGRTSPADVFAKKTYTTSSGIRYDYAEYIPEKDTDTLLVWLHGLGEGYKEGSDVHLPLLGHKGTELAGDKFQSTVGGAVVVVPQCPTYWMDADGQETNFTGTSIDADGTSFYTESLYEFIDGYAKTMNARRIMLAGCSNGGYMCLMLSIYDPNRWEAVVPICEAVPDRYLSDESLEKLLNVPLYFVYSKDDPIVPPTEHEIPTIERLKKAGHKDLHASVTEHVEDHTGNYKDEEGNPYRYLGHLSWIYFDNDETDDGTGLTSWQWMADKLSENS